MNLQPTSYDIASATYTEEWTSPAQTPRTTYDENRLPLIANWRDPDGNGVEAEHDRT